MSNGYTNNSSIVSGLRNNQSSNLLDMGNVLMTAKMAPAMPRRTGRIAPPGQPDSPFPGNNLCCPRSCNAKDLNRRGPPPATEMCPNACVNIRNENKVVRGWLQPSAKQMEDHFDTDRAANQMWRLPKDE